MNNCPGFTLLEILISLSLFTLSLLTLSAAEQATLRSSRAHHYFTQATVLAQNMSRYLQTPEGDNTSYQSTWRKQIQSVLPASTGTITPQNRGYRITITWGGLAPQQCTKTQTGIKGCLIEYTV